LLSYQHGYHAGNHADVLKHLVLHRVLSYLNQKSRGWTFLDTHAGSGLYNLHGDKALQTGDADSGILRIRGATDAPAPIRAWLEHIKRADGNYPGSPLLAASLARPVDRLVFCERHPGEYRTLEASCRSSAAVIRAVEGDGFAAVKYTLPPPTRRGAVLIDPSYERDEDWTAVIDAVTEGLRRFATGTIMIWYPRLTGRDNSRFVRTLESLAPKAWLHAILDVATAAQRSFYGSGLFVINPPWTLASELELCLPWLMHVLGQARDGAWRLRHSQ
jgi:23S rRNA (adenine2030-N6)-methyltransferase